MKGVELKPDEVVVETVAGDRFRGRFLIDAGGMRSHVATQLGLRDATPRFATDTRVLYTHFTGVKPYDLVAGDAEQRTEREGANDCFHDASNDQ